jgi:hypothetical protein
MFAQTSHASQSARLWLEELMGMLWGYEGVSGWQLQQQQGFFAGWLQVAGSLAKTLATAATADNTHVYSLTAYSGVHHKAEKGCKHAT